MASEGEKLFYEAIVRRLTNERVRRRVTQRELDDALNVAEGLVGKWESFQRLPGAFLLMCWCKSLGVTLIPVGDND